MLGVKLPILSCEGFNSPPTGIFVTNALTRKTKLRVRSSSEFGNFVQNPAVNDAGTIVFSGLGISGFGSDSVSGLFTAAVGGGPILLAHIDNGACTPLSQGCQRAEYNESLSINSGGAVAAGVITFTAAGGAFIGTTLNGDIKNGRVAWPGGTINGCSVVEADAGQRSINAAGQIALFLSCADTGNGQFLQIVVATPN